MEENKHLHGPEDPAENSCGHEGCGCGHEHNHEHGHSHEHSHEHSHDGQCSCGCGHEHSHEHGHSHEHSHEHSHDGQCSCGCGHEHSHEHGHSHEHSHSHGHHNAPSSPCTVYVMKNIDCANCSAKIEAKIKELPEVDDAVLTFATRQLRVYSSAGTALLPKMQEIADKIEPGTRITVREEGKRQKDVHNEKHSSDLPEILAGAGLFIAGSLLAGPMPGVSILCFVIAYLILGKDVLFTALKNMKTGHVMDENFLMSLATLGAFVIREYGEAVGVMLFYRIGEAFEHRAVEKSRSQIMDAVDLRPETVLLDEGGSIREIPAESARIGQVIQVRPGDRIPLDGVIIEGESRLDTSPITGEPVPVAVREGSSVLSGCVNTSGLLKLRVEKELSESMVTRILDSVENAAAQKPQVERFITKFARIYTPVVVALAAVTAILPSLFTGDWNHWVYTALTFLVISCPCALVLSVPLSFFSGIGAGSRKGILFKGGIALEALKNVKVVVMDKTGTITKGNFVVQTVSPSGSMKKEELLALAAACETASTHPIGISILAAARDQSLSVETPRDLAEIPGKGIRAVTSAGVLLCGNRKLLEENQVDLAGFKEDSGSTMVLLAKDGVYAGSISISDTIKPEASAAIASLKKMGIEREMVRGSRRPCSPETAKPLQTPWPPPPASTGYMQSSFPAINWIFCRISGRKLETPCS